MSDHELESGVETITEDETELREPKLYRVILLNDDYTTMDFVVMVLETIFRKSPAEAVKIMLQVHNDGHGLCGVFTKEVAETKIAQVHQRAQQEGHPLRCDIREA